MILNRIIKKITKITKFEVKNLTTVFKWKMPFFYSQEGVNHYVYGSGASECGRTLVAPRTKCGWSGGVEMIGTHWSYLQRREMVRCFIFL